MNPPARMTGPEAIAHALQRLNVEELDKEQREVIRSKKKTARPRAVRLINILEGFKRSGLSPEKLMISSVPVIPPAYRPFAVTGETFLPGDANELYKDLFEYKRLYSAAHKSLGQEGADEVYKDLRRSAKALYGYGDSPNPKTATRGVKGFFHAVTGASPKTSFYQSKLLSKTVDNVGRGVIIPDADLGMDEVGMPENMAWKQYAQYVQRRLVMSGMSPPAALRHLTDKSEQARKALQTEMTARPVYISRAPSWHDHNVVGQTPRIVQGDAIRINPYIAEGANADFDGNCIVGSVNITLRISAEAILRMRFIADGSNADFADCMIKFGVDITEKKNESNCTMRVTATTKVLQIDKDGAIFEIAMRDFPRDESNPRVDKNGAKVFSVPCGVTVLTCAADGKGTRWSEVTDFTVEDGCGLVELITTSGKSVGISDNESVAVPDGVGGFAKVTPASAVGQLIPVIRNIPIATDGKHDLEFGWMLGSFLSDGWVSEGYVGYSKASASTRKRFLSSFCKAAGFPETSVRHYETLHDASENHGIGGLSSKLHFSENGVCAELFAYLRDNCYANCAVVGRASLRKKMPDDVATYSRAALLGILSGMFDGDGSLSINTSRAKAQVLANYSTSSPYLRDGVMMLLKLLGVRTNYTTVKPKQGRAQRHDNFIITLSTPDLAKIAHEIVLTSASPALDLLRRTGVAKDDRDIIPTPHAFIDRVIQLNPSGVSVESLKVLKSRWRTTPYVSMARAKVRELLACYTGDTDQIFEATRAYAEETDLMWEKVASCESIPTETVYDIVVPETKVYAIANGLIVYDTMSIHVPSSPEAVKDVRDRIMASKMPWSIKDFGKTMGNPKHEQLIGLFMGSDQPSGKKHSFNTEEELDDAISKGVVDLNDEVEIYGSKK